MNTLHFSKSVKFKNPQPGEEDLIFNITNYNEVTNRCYIQPINLQGWNEGIFPSELVSLEELVFIDEAEKR